MSRNPYLIKDRKPHLQNSVFVFMDILGYSDLMVQAQKSGTEEATLRDLHSALTTSRTLLEDEPALNDSTYSSEKNFYALKAFTDNIVIGWPIHSDAEAEFGSAFMRLAMFQFKMATHGYFIRGAISVGPAFIDDIAVFGDALQQAYIGETKHARDPRIIFTSSAVQAATQHIAYYSQPQYSPHARDILKDSDGQWFLNYLEAVLIAEDERGPFYPELLQHKAAIEAKLSTHRSNPPVWAKYAWVAGYHNYFCDLHSNHFRDEHRIDVELFRSTPTRIDETF